MAISLKEVSGIYTDHVDKIYKFFYYKTLSESIAEDLTSETFLKFTSAVVKENKVNDPKLYLYGIAKHVFIHFLQKKYQEKDLMTYVADYEQVAAEAYMVEYVEAAEDSPTLEDMILPFIQQLPEKQKSIVSLRVIEKLPPSEIARQIGKDTNYVKTTLKRGLKRLRQLVACTPESTYSTEKTL
jgi:RNA polymerase sigma-70 factor (ECF subfamily)